MKNDALFGLGGAVLVGLLGLLAVKGGFSAAGTDSSVRDLATLLALVFGILSAVWWHQSADIANDVIERDQRDRQREKDANVLSGAAATATALALVASVFTGLPWPSPEATLCALGFLLLVAMSGDDIRHAGRISLRERLKLRALIGFAVLGILLALFLLHRLRE